MAIVFSNNARTTLASNISNSATTITVADGSVFPSLTGGDIFYCTIDDGTNNEIVEVTAISSNTLTVVRGQDNTTARAFVSGDLIELRLVAKVLETFPQVDAGEVTADEFIGDLRGAVIFKAQAGEAVSKGDAVYVSGITGNTPIVALADADFTSKMPAFGLVLTAASANGSTEVVTFGTISGLDTSAFSLGDTLYVSTTAGALTNSKPTGESSLIQNIGKVQKSHASSGSIKVGGAGRSNDTPNLNDGNIFIGNASNQATTASLNTKIEDYLDSGTSTPSFAAVSSGAISSSQNININASGTNNVSLEVGANTTANHYSFIDLIGDTTYSDYGLRIIRNNTGANSSAFIYHRGTGNFNIETQDSASIRLRTAATTALTLDTSQNATFAGNLLVGTTDNNVTNNTGNTPGINIGVAGIKGYIAAARYQGAPLALNRLDNDGDIAVFSKNGSTVGTIGSSFGNRLYIGDGDTAIRFADDLDTIVPWNGSTNALRDNAIDLGESTGRFKDLYLSGSISASDLLTENNVSLTSHGTVDLVTIGSGSRAGAIKINDIAGANYFITGGGYDLTFYKNVSGTSNVSVMQFVGANASDSTPDVSITNNLSTGGSITSSSIITSATTGTANAKLIADGGGAANIEIDRGSTSYHNNLLYRTAGAVKWRIWQSGADNVLAVRNEVAGTNVLSFTDTNSTFAGTINSGAITSSGDITSRTGAYPGGRLVLDRTASSSGAMTSAEILFRAYGNNTTLRTFGKIEGRNTGYDDGEIRFYTESNGTLSEALTLSDTKLARFYGNVHIGQSDSSGGVLALEGNGTGSAEGGEIQLKLAADHDGTYDHYRIDTYQDDLRIGRAGTTDLYLFQDGKFKVGNAFEVDGTSTFGQNVTIENGASFEMDGAGDFIMDRTDNGFSFVTSSAMQSSSRDVLFQAAGGGTSSVNFKVLHSNIVLGGTTEIDATNPQLTFRPDDGILFRLRVDESANRLEIGHSSNKNLYLSNTGNATFNYGLTVQGDLVVNGTTTTLNTATLDVEDKNITLNYSTGDSSGSANDAGITIQDAVSSTQDAQMLWKTATDTFDFSHGVNVTGELSTTSGITSGGSINIDASGTGERFLQIGTDTTANHFAYIDLVGDTTYTDYGFRIIRGDGGANTTSEIIHRGTGDFEIQATDAANIILKTSNAPRLTINSAGNFDFNGGNLNSVGTLTTTNQTGQIWEAPSAASGNTNAHQMRSRWNATNDRWFIVPFPEGSALYNREFYYDYNNGNWVLEGAPTLDASGLHGTPNITVGTINSGSIVSTGSITTNSGIFINSSEQLYIYRSAANELSVRTGASGSYKYFTFESGGDFHVLGGNLKANGLTVSTGSGASIALEDSGSHTWYLTTDNQDNFFRVKDGTSATYLKVGTADSEFATNLNLTSGHELKINGTTAIDSSRKVNFDANTFANVDDYVIHKDLGSTSDNSTPHYVLVCPYDTGANSQNAAGVDGMFFFDRGSTGSFNIHQFVDISAKTAWSSTIVSRYSASSGYKLSVVTYNSVNYLAIYVPQTSSRKVGFTGTRWKQGGFTPSMVASTAVTVVTATHTDASLINFNQRAFNLDFSNNMTLSGSLTVNSNFETNGVATFDNNGVISTAGNRQFQVRDSDNTNLNLYIIADKAHGTNGGAIIQVTESGVSNDRPLFLQGHGGNVAIGNQGSDPSEKLVVSGNLLLDSDNAEINLKSGGIGTIGAVNWTFNTTGTNYAAIKLPYDTRASVGFHIDSGYPITLDSTTNTNFAISGTTYGQLNTTGLAVNRVYGYNDSAGIRLGNFSSGNTDETGSSVVRFLRAADASGWDQYYIKGSTSRGVFGTQFIGWHMDASKSWGVFSSGWDTEMQVDAASGKTYIKQLGVGTVPTAQLDVRNGDNHTANTNDWGIASFEDGSNSGMSIGYNTAGNAFLYARTRGTDGRKLVINDTLTVTKAFTGGDGKRVGILNNSPAHALDVTGDAHLTGRLYTAAITVDSTTNSSSVQYGSNQSRTFTKDNAGATGSQSGFFETASPTNYYSGASSWQHLIEARHSNNANNYSMQIAGSFFDQDFYVRKTNNSATTAWTKMALGSVDNDIGALRIHTGNINNTNTNLGLFFDGNYETGQFRHRLRKSDPGSGLPLHIDYAHTTANSYTTIAQFGGGGTYPNFEVFGGASECAKFHSTTTDSRAIKIQDRSNNGGNIIQFLDTSGSNIWELVGRSSTFYVYKNSGTGSGYKWQINSSGQHTFTGDVFYPNAVTFNGTVGGSFTSSDFRQHLQGTVGYDGSTANYPSHRLTHTRGNRAWGNVLEIRQDNASDSDRPSMIFTAGQESGESWSVGYGFTDDQFRIKKDHGYVSNSWGTALMTMNRTGDVTFAGNVTAYSDERLKENIKTIPNAIDTVKQIRGVTYNWKETGKEGLGVIAQEIEKVPVLKSLVSETAEDGSTEFKQKNVAYGNMVGLLIEAIKEQQEQIESLKSEINNLKGGN